MPNTKPLRVGVIGCGTIAQVMHLPHLDSFPDLFELAALSDISPGVLRAIGDLYHVPERARFPDYRDLIASDLDAVFVLTGGNHYPPALAALRAGRHVFAEKPMCYGVREADELVEAAQNHHAKLMVGYMKRYDPGYLYGQQRVREMTDLRYVQINTLHPSEDQYLGIYNLVRFNDVPAEVLGPLLQAEREQIRAAVGDVSQALQGLYTGVFLGSMVHDTNALRGLVGEPDGVLFTEVWSTGGEGPSITTTLAYPGDLRVVYTWTYLPTLRDYFQEIAVMSPANRVRIQFPSPYLKHFPTPVVFQGMEDGAEFEKHVTASYAEAFKQELIAFHDCIVNDKQPLTDGADAHGDIQLLQRIFAAFHPEGLGGEAAERGRGRA